MARRKYSQEYKQKAVLLVKQSGSPTAEVARNLGINYNVLMRWVKEYSEPGKKSFPGKVMHEMKKFPALEKNLLRLKRNEIF